MGKLINYSNVNDGILYSWIPQGLEYEKIIFFPDACPSRGLMPTGTSVLTKQENWRKFVISDVGCGMTLCKSKLKIEEFSNNLWDNLYKLLKASKGTQADLGSGNHFLNCYADENGELYMSKYIDKMIETIQEFGQCTVYLSDGDMITVEPAENFIGGEEEYYMCDVIGNVQYDDIAEICEDVLTLIIDRELDIDSIEVD